MADTITLGLLITASAGAATGAVQSLGQTIEKLKAQTDKVSASQVTLGAAIKKDRKSVV